MIEEVNEYNSSGIIDMANKAVIESDVANLNDSLTLAFVDLKVAYPSLTTFEELTTIVVNDNIEVTIIDIQGDQVRVGINAPKDVKVFRKEVYLEMMEENQRAAQVQMQALDMLKNAINRNKKY